jgi:putative membrane protein
MWSSPWMMGSGMWFFELLIIAGIAYLLWSNFAPRRQAQTNHNDPLEYAKLRLARGEITVEEYDKIKKTIESG